MRDFAHGLAEPRRPARGRRRGPRRQPAGVADRRAGRAVPRGRRRRHLPDQRRRGGRARPLLAEVRVVVAEDQEQVDKLIRLAEAPSRRPAASSTSSTTTRTASRSTPSPGCSTSPRSRRRPARVGAGRAGSTSRSPPAGTVRRRRHLHDLRHDRQAQAGRAHPRQPARDGEHLTSVDPIGPTTEYVSFLPLAWIGEQMLASPAAARAACALLPGGRRDAEADLREIGPDVMFSRRGSGESMLSEVQVADRRGRLAQAQGLRLGLRHR